MTIPRHILTFFAAYIEAEIGVVYAEANFYQLESRLSEISRTLGYDDIETFWVQCTKSISAKDKGLLLDVATNNETSFFRDPDVFAAIKTHILPAFRESQPLKIWSAACSTGQEPYSLAMMISDDSDPTLFSRTKIQATDVSERALAQAISGRYSQLEVNRGLSEAQIHKFFNQEKTLSEPDANRPWSVRPAIKQMVEFKKFNLLQSWPVNGPFDLILCRNVLIYHTPQNKRTIIQRFQKLLHPGGYLVLGGAESLIGLSDEFTLKNCGKAILYQNANDHGLKKAGNS